MNENPGETPNPLNPNPTPVVGPAPTPVSDPMLKAAPSPAPNPVVNPAPTQPAASTTTAPVEPLAPVGQPIEQAAPAPEPVKKKKTGLIAGIIAAVVVLIGGGVAAAMVIMNMNKPDPVAAAMNKIMSGQAPTKVAIDGNIDIIINNDLSPISKVNIVLNSKLTTTSAANDSVANVTATLRNIGDLQIEFDEVYAGNGDLYFKIDGAKSALEKSGLLYLLNMAGQMKNEIDCGDDEYCQVKELEDNCGTNMNCVSEGISDDEYYIIGDGGQSMLDESTITYFASLAGSVLEVIDGEWLKVSVGDLSNWSDGMLADSNISCITNLVSDINTNSDSAAILYNKYPFISSTNEGVKLASKKYPVYQVSIDSKNFANYVNGVQNSEMTSNLYSCLGWQDNVSISTDDVVAIVEEMPVVYVEVDENNNFTRLYLESSIEDYYDCACTDVINEGECDCAEPTSTDIRIDLGFSYPQDVDVSEPEEYRNFADVIQEISSGIYNLPENTKGVVVETESTVIETVDN